MNDIDGKVLPDGAVWLRVPLPPSKNREPSHWTRQRKVKHEWKMYAYQAWLLAGRPRLLGSKVRVTLRFYCYRLRDEDNNNSLGVKGAIDGLKGSLFTDDSPRFMELAPIEAAVDRKNQRLEIEVRRVG